MCCACKVVVFGRKKNFFLEKTGKSFSPFCLSKRSDVGVDSVRPVDLTILNSCSVAKLLNGQAEPGPAGMDADDLRRLYSRAGRTAVQQKQYDY